MKLAALKKQLPSALLTFWWYSCETYYFSGSQLISEKKKKKKLGILERQSNLLCIVMSWKKAFDILVFR